MPTPHIGHSAKLYQERREKDIRITLRGPGPQINLADNAVHHLKLEAPLPNPALIKECGPDGVRTTAWPHGDKYVP